MNNVDCEALLKQGVICAKKQITAYCTTDLSIFKERARTHQGVHYQMDKTGIIPGL